MNLRIRDNRHRPPSLQTRPNRQSPARRSSPFVIPFQYGVPLLTSFAKITGYFSLGKSLIGRVGSDVSRGFASQGTEKGQHALLFAHHLVLGNRQEEASKYFILGAGQLLEQQLYASAVTPLETAMRLAEGGVKIQEPDRALLLFRLGETYRVLGRGDEALRVLESARSAAQGADVALGASIELARGSIKVQRGMLDEAEEIFRSVLAMKLPQEGLQIAGAVSGLAAIYRIRGRQEEALKEHLRALDLREKAGAETEVAISCVNVGNTYCDLGQYAEAERVYRRSLPIFEAKGLKNYLIYALSGLGNVLFRGDRRQALKQYEDAMRLCQETGNRSQLGVLHYNLGEIALADHRYSESLWELTRALGIMEAVGRRSGEAEARCRKAELHRILGEFERAREELEKAQEISKATGSRPDQAAARVENSLLAQASGDLARAREEIEEALRLLEGLAEAPLRLAAARILIDLGETARASREIEEGARAPSLHSEPDLLCLLEHLRGAASVDPAEGLRHIERALELAGESYRDLPRLLSDLATRREGERSRDLHTRAVQLLTERSQGIREVEGRRKFIIDNPIHREILSRARQAGVAS